MSDRPVLATFYAYVPGTNELRKNKFQVEYPKYEYIIGRSKQEDRYISKYEPIVFDKGVYEARDEDIVEYLRIYNTGGTLPNEKDALGRPLQVKWESILAVIKESAPVTTNTVVKTETVTKEVHTIPREFVLALDFQALQSYCVAYGIAMPKEKTKESIIKALETEGYIHD